MDFSILVEKAQEQMAQPTTARRKRKGRSKTSYLIRREGAVVKEQRVVKKERKRKAKSRSVQVLAPFDRSYRNWPEDAGEQSAINLRKYMGKYAYEKWCELNKVLGGLGYHPEDLLPASVNELLTILDESRKDGAKSLVVQEVCYIGVEERLGKFAGSFEKVSSVSQEFAEPEEEDEVELIGVAGATFMASIKVDK